MFTLKRALEVEWKLCIFCQTHNKPKDDVKEAKSHSKNVVYEATTKHRKYTDVANREVIDRLEDLQGRNDDTCTVWHSNCYAQYTSKEKIQHLQQKGETTEELRQATSAPNSLL